MVHGIAVSNPRAGNRTPRAEALDVGCLFEAMGRYGVPIGERLKARGD